jgi:hypothetical protein
MSYSVFFQLLKLNGYNLFSFFMPVFFLFSGETS